MINISAVTVLPEIFWPSIALLVHGSSSQYDLPAKKTENFFSERILIFSSEQNIIRCH